MQEPLKIQIPQEYRPLFGTDWRHLLIHGGRFSLKSHTTARALLLRARNQKLRVLCAREFQNSIEDSSLQLLTDLIELYDFKDYIITKNSIVNTVTGSDFLFKGLRNNSQSIKSIEGIDIAWVEEAQGITRESIDILVPTVRKPGSQLIWTFNRITELDPVYAMFALQPRADTIVLNLNYDIAEKYGWLPAVIKAEIEHDRLNNPEVYAHKWLGQPIAQSDAAIISRTAVLAAMQRKVSDEGAIEVGVDVARLGDDRTVITVRKGMKVLEIKQYTKLRTTEVVDRIKDTIGNDKTVPVKVDDTGVGSGVTDQLLQEGYNAIPVNNGCKSSQPDKYPNLVSEAWFYLADIMDEIELPMDADLLMEASNRRKVMDTKGRRAVEGKDAFKKRGYRSPDLIDSVILAFFTPVVHKLDWAAPYFG